MMVYHLMVAIPLLIVCGFIHLWILHPATEWYRRLAIAAVEFVTISFCMWLTSATFNFVFPINNLS